MANQSEQKDSDAARGSILYRRSSSGIQGDFVSESRATDGDIRVTSTTVNEPKRKAKRISVGGGDNALVYSDHMAATIHEAMEDLLALGFVDKSEMKELDDALLTTAKPFLPEQLKALRDRENASQAVLARYLGVSVNTVSQWERGERRATGASAKLLTLVEKHGLAYIR